MNWVVMWLGVLIFPGAPGPEPAAPEGNAPIDFHRDIRPILSDRCFYCHGPDETHREAGLRLDDEAKAKAARKRGRVIVPGKPEESLLIKRILSADAGEVMPPPRHGKDLTQDQKKLLTRWIAEGARWAKPWALEPLAAAKPGESIDRLLMTSWAKAGLEHAPRADAVTLWRRLHFDLTGLPPQPRIPAKVDEQTYAAKVDELLASDAHAERMATWWLDLVRFADTVGYHGDQDHHSTPYRDWVIDAFAQNMRFDAFTRFQLAGDLLPLKGEEAIDAKIASCYNRLLQTSHEGGVQAKEYLAIYQADRVRNVSAVWMAATMGCAQCHTHKFDPYTIRDFYSFAAFFADIDEEKHLRGGGGDTVPTKRPPEIKVIVKRERAELAQIKAKIAELNRRPEDSRSELADWLKREKALSAGRLVMVSQAIAPRTVRVLARGNWMDDTGEKVEPAVPQFLGKVDGDGKRLTRLDLANWLTDAEKGAGILTARVVANRIWCLLLGEGLSPSLEDFGAQGEAPSQPQLLDHLARHLIESGWDLRSLIRLIVLSETYRQSSRETDILREKDPQNRLFARQASHRLSAEMVRDNALAVSGLLHAKVGGSSFKPYQPEGYYNLLNFPRRGYQATKGPDQYRRALYIHWQRQFLHPMLRAFEATSREECTVKRPRSNTPQAALVLLNDPTFLEAARALASTSALQEVKDDEDAIRKLFQRVTGRSPVAAEQQELNALLDEARKAYRSQPKEAAALLGLQKADHPMDRAKTDRSVEWAAWTTVCRALLNLAETNTRN